jgi:hypothetical protein
MHNSIVNFRQAIVAAGCGAILLAASPSGFALDKVFPFKGTQASGTIESIKNDEVVLKVGGSEQKFATDSIRKIVFDDEPSKLNRGRDLALDGQYSEALEELKLVDNNELTNDFMKADYLFYRAYCEGKLALAGRGERKSAAEAMFNFAKQNQKSFHLYDASEMLGDLAVAGGDFAAAEKFYAKLGSAPFAEYKLRARYLEGNALLRSDKFAEAKPKLEEVAKAEATSPNGVRIKKLASAALAISSSREGNHDQALATITDLITSSEASDVELFAKLYNAEGSCLAGKGDVEGAILAYLHTDLLFPNYADTHAEALHQLSQLWPKVQKQERGNDARARLEKLYPGAKFGS